MSLSSDVVLEAERLHDTSLDVTHELRGSGAYIIRMLQNEIPVEGLLKAARSRRVADGQLYELLGFLNAIGCLRRKRHPNEQLKAVYGQALHMCFGTRYTPLAWRRSSTARYVMAGVIRATVPIWAATLFVCFLVGGSGLLPVSVVVRTALFGALLFVFSLFAHETAHIITIKGQGVEPIILQIGLRLGIIHRKLQSRAEIVSSLAGPVFGGLCCIAASVAVAILQLEYLVLLSLMIGSFHLLALLPWYGDGASMYKALRERRFHENND